MYKRQAYEIAYCTVAADGTPGTAMLATCDSNLDENPQVVAANFTKIDISNEVLQKLGYSK